MRFNEAKLFERAIEEGLRYGIHRWNKYDRQPPLPEDTAKVSELADHLAGHVMDGLYEICYFQAEDSHE